MPDKGGIALKSLFWPVISWIVKSLRGVKIKDIGKNMPSLNDTIIFLGNKVEQLEDGKEETLVKVTGISMKGMLLGNWHVRMPYIEMLYIYPDNLYSKMQVFCVERERVRSRQQDY